MTAHQPNLFAYGGVLRKATLNRVLAKMLSESLDVPTVSFFGFADQDFTDDRWVRSALMPDLERRDGILELRVPLPEKVLLNKTEKPPVSILGRWEQDVQNWIHRKTKSIAELAGVQLDENDYLENFRELWSITSDSHVRAASCADFSAFIISKIVNDRWGYDTLFCRFSEGQQVFAGEFKLLIQRFREYSQAVREAQEMPGQEEGGISGDEYLTLPVWYSCDCGSKARLWAVEEGHATIGRGNCLLCGKQSEIDFSSESQIWSDPSRLSARALAMPLVFFEGLGVSCYVGGVGGRQYLQQAKHIADRMRMRFPPVVIWRPHDSYLGLAQLEALLTVKKLAGAVDTSHRNAAEAALRDKLTTMQRRIDELEARKKQITASTRERSEKIDEARRLAKQQGMIRRETDSAMLARHLGLLDNSERVLALHPCVIDYGVNLGLRNVSEQWEAFLKTVGDLGSDVVLRTKIDQQFSYLGS